MVYKVIGLMSGSSLDGLDIAYVELHENRGEWSFEILAADCYAYDEKWQTKLQHATNLNARDYQLLHAEYGHFLGAAVVRFIEQYNLHYKVALIASHGHTSFHMPDQQMTAQLGDGAAIAAETGLPVVSDLRALDVAFGGQGAPIVPIGEKYLFKEYPVLLNIGGIANISFNLGDNYAAYDVCAANRVLNLLANKEGKEYDENGSIAATGTVHEVLLEQLNALDYYKQPYPKSLANDFGTDIVFPLIASFQLSTSDALRTYVRHIAMQIAGAVKASGLKAGEGEPLKMLVTGGGALNGFLMKELSQQLELHNAAAIVPETNIVQYKEALVMALIGVLRWRQEYNVLASVTGARRDSICGAVWIGQEA